ncbi:MAG: hypothetical protein LAP13_14845 [Acidobacteriia bacterium]|nr:hypothetical protein [Terriglobia bacterium]
MSFITKGNKRRVDETVAFIANKVPGPERAAVKEFLYYLIDWLFPSGPNFKYFSRSMTMTNAEDPGDKADRAARRALIMLDSLKNPPAYLAAKTLPTDTVNQELDDLIAKLRMAADGAYGTGHLLQTEFLTQLRTRTRLFLREHKFFEGSITNRGVGYFYCDFRLDRYQIEGNRPQRFPHAHEFETVSIPAVAWYNVPGRTDSQTAGSFAQIVGTELTGAETLVTTQFTGCSFCFKVVGGRIFAAHIMPSDGLGGQGITGGGPALARQLAGTVGGITGGDFAAPCPNGGQLYVYGAGYSNLPRRATGYPPGSPRDHTMYIFGTVNHGGWRLYTKHLNGDTSETHRLYPF